MTIRYAIAHIHRLNRPPGGASKDVGMEGRDKRAGSWESERESESPSVVFYSL